jgi:hypothetical protein
MMVMGQEVFQTMKLLNVEMAHAKFQAALEG